jgi:hypothetical protein
MEVAYKLLGEFTSSTPYADERWYAVELNDVATAWLEETFVKNKDYFWNRTLKGVWVNVTSQVYEMIILKWK